MNEKYKQIDGREFVSLITANQRRIYSYILTLVPNFNDADDILQETTALMWEKKEEFMAGTDFVAWGARIAYFKILEYRKKVYKDRRMVLMDQQFSQIADQSIKQSQQVDETISKVRECLKKLPNPDRQLMHLRYTVELSVRDIALRVNKSIRSIYLNISRIQDLLMKCIERHNS